MTSTQSSIHSGNMKNRQLIKSKTRVRKYGEVFTPNWIVKKMLSEPSIQEKIKDLNATFLEPSSGEGAFLTELVSQRMDYIDKLDSDNWQYNVLRGLSTIYGIELLDDNLKIARKAMIDIVEDHYIQLYGLLIDYEFIDLAKSIVEKNIVQGNALTHKNKNDDWIVFSHWQISKDLKATAEQFKYDELFK